MPTGYTAKIRDGITFATFAMDCARGMGACVTLRDEPGGGEHIPESFEPSGYHLRAIADEQRKLAGLELLTDDEADRLAVAEWNASRERDAVRVADARELRERYEAMLRRVEEWDPPTGDHVGLQRFMAQQITESIRFDCPDEPYRECKTYSPMTGAEWRAAKIADAKERIESLAKYHAGEVERAASRTAWVKSLRDSLKEAATV